MITVRVRDRDVYAIPLWKITTGSVGLPVAFEFDEAWDGLTKIAVFRGSDTDVEVALLIDSCVVPPEVLTVAGGDLKIGVYGRDAYGTVVIPTIWGTAGHIYDGTAPEDPDPTDPTPEWSYQVQQAAANALRIAQGVAAAAENGDFDGEDGISPTVAVADITGGHRITITDADGVLEFDVMDGTDGVSPSVTITTITGGHRVTIIDKDHPTGQSFDVMDGEGGGQSTYQYVPENLIDPDTYVGTMTINGSSVSGLSNWIPLEQGAVYTTDYTSTQFYFFDTNKEYVTTQTLIQPTNSFQATTDGYLLIRTKGDDKTFVRGSYLTYDVGVVSRWNGKKWLAIGDSITSLAVADEGYPYIVGSYLGMEVTNVGNSGKVMSYFHSLIADYADDYDLITVLLGTNNQGYNTAIGALNDQYYQNEDYDSNNSFFAQTQRLADLLIAKYPYATIVFLTPIRRSASANDGTDKTNALGLTTKPYADAVMAVCDAYSLPCLDLYTHGINPKYDAIRAAFFVNGDGTHPNNDGHAKFTAPDISDYLSRIAPFAIDPPSPTPTPTLESITAVYTGGDVPAGTNVSDLTGITVTAHYSDSTSATVSGYALSGTIGVGANTITVSYEGLTTTFTVTGTSAPTLTSISAVYTGGAVPAGTDVNELTGITVTGHYSDSSTSVISSGYTLSGTIAVGNNTVTISYSGFTTTITVVGEAAPTPTATLLHQYSYTAGGEDFGDGVVGFHDEVGDYDISTAYASNSVKGDPADTDAARTAWGLNPGDSFTFKFKGVKRTTRYPLSQGIDFALTAGSGQNTACLGRGGTDRIYKIAQGGNTAQTEATTLLLKLYSGTNGSTDTTEASTLTFAPMNGEPQDLELRYDASTGTVTAYVDGTEFINHSVDASRKEYVHVDGFSMVTANIITNSYYVFDKIQIFKGLAEVET